MTTCSAEEYELQVVMTERAFYHEFHVHASSPICDTPGLEIWRDLMVMMRRMIMALPGYLERASSRDVSYM